MEKDQLYAKDQPKAMWYMSFNKDERPDDDRITEIPRRHCAVAGQASIEQVLDIVRFLSIPCTVREVQNYVLLIPEGLCSMHDFISVMLDYGEETKEGVPSRPMPLEQAPVPIQTLMSSLEL